MQIKIPFFITGREGRVIDKIEFITTDGSSLGSVGGMGGREWNSYRADGKLLFITGSAGRYLDSISLVYECD